MTLDDLEVENLRNRLFDMTDHVDIDSANFDSININALDLRDYLDISPEATISIGDRHYKGKQLAYLLDKLELMCREKYPEDFV